MLIVECRQGAPNISRILSRLKVCLETGRLFWIDATKHHARLNGLEAGCPRKTHNGKQYWHVKIDGKAIKRSHIVLAVATGIWPTDCVDHINGDSLDDRSCNLRHATAQQNCWNHKRRQKASPLPMGVREIRPGHFQARIAVNKKQLSLGVFDSICAAQAAYLSARKEYFGDYS